MTDDDLLKLFSKLLGLIVQDTNIGVLDAISAVHLLDQKLAVAVNNQPSGAQLGGSLQSADERGVFGQVIGRHSQQPIFFDGRRSFFLDDESKGGRSRVAAGRAVNVDFPGDRERHRDSLDRSIPPVYPAK